MAAPMEVAVCTDSAAQLWSCVVWELHSGANLLTYRGGQAGPRGLALLNGEYLLAAQLGKNYISAWELQRKVRLRALRRRSLVSREGAVGSARTTSRVGGRESQLGSSAHAQVWGLFLDVGGARPGWVGAVSALRTRGAEVCVSRAWGGGPLDHQLRAGGQRGLGVGPLGALCRSWRVGREF